MFAMIRWMKILLPKLPHELNEVDDFQYLLHSDEPIIESSIENQEVDSLSVKHVEISDTRIRNTSMSMMTV